MPRITKFKDGDMIISVCGPGYYGNHKLCLQDIAKVYFDEYGQTWHARLVKVSPVSTHKNNQGTDYDDRGCRLLTRSDVVGILREEAKTALEKAEANFKAIGLYQKYPTAQEELDALIELYSTDGLTEQAVAEALANSSFKIEPLKNDDCMDLEDNLREWA